MTTEILEDPRFIELKARLARADDLRKLLYTQENCSRGGPFHCVIDDGNVTDKDLAFAYRMLHQSQYESIRAIGMALFHELVFLTPAQRFLWTEGEADDLTIWKAVNHVVAYDSERCLSLAIPLIEATEKGFDYEF